MYVDTGKVFAHLDRLIGWQRGERPGPVTVEWDLSNRCVLGCQDCHFAHTHVKGPWTGKTRSLPMAFESTGDLADLALVDRALAEMAAAGVRGVVWSGGGEPTTHPHWQTTLTLAAGYGLAQGMYTLGGLLTPEAARFLGEIAEWVVVSLDAVDGDSYAAEKGVPAARFASACAGIRSLIGRRAIVGVSFLLHAGNYSRAWDMLARARELGATYTTFRPAIRVAQDTPASCADDRGWIAASSPLLDQLAAEPDVEISPARFAAYATWDGHGYRECHGVRLHATVTPDGRVWICPQRRGVTPLGDLRVESFGQLWARHPGRFSVDVGCRVMCRLHSINQQLAELERPRLHEAFV